MPQDRHGLVCAFSIAPSTGANKLSWEEVVAWQPSDDFLWVHVDYSGEDVHDWLETEEDLGPVVTDALLAHDPRPRCTAVGDGLVLIIRAVNLNAGADPEDMVSLRVWADTNRVITMRHRKVNAIQSMRDNIEAGKLPTSSGDLTITIIEHILHQIARVADKLDDDVDAIEDQVLDAENFKLRHRVAHFRRAAIALRRHVAPQREVLGRLHTERFDWIDDQGHARLRECSERLARIIDEVDSAKERALVTSEEITSQLSDQMNRRLYALSIIAAIFLPLGFITGALGVNLGGMPGTEFAGSFAIMCGVMVILGFAQVWYFKKGGWM